MLFRVPEPAALLLIAIGLAALSFARTRRPTANCRTREA
jgi:hypothetical protein